jgi:hypothetical protein
LAVNAEEGTSSQITVKKQADDSVKITVTGMQHPFLLLFHLKLLFRRNGASKLPTLAASASGKCDFLPAACLA